MLIHLEDYRKARAARSSARRHDEELPLGETAMLINLDDYRKARAARSSARRHEEELLLIEMLRNVPARSAARYDGELLCVNWNPAFSVVALSCFKAPQELSPQLPEDFADVNVSTLLDRLHELATQI